MAIKVKRRYILVECATEIGSNSRTQFERSILGALMEQMGVLHYQGANPKIVGFVDAHRFVVRASLEGHKELELALAMIKRLGGAETAFYTLKSSGTIRALMKAGKE